MPVVLNELLARLRVDFPLALAQLDATIAPPPTADSYRLAPGSGLGDGFAHTVLVGNDLDFEAGGTRVFLAGSTLQIFIIDEKNRIDFDVLNYWSQVVAMLSTNYSYLTGCVNASGVNMWKKLIPISISGLPESYASGYHGVMLTYQMEFTPQSSGWPQTLSGALQ